MDVDPTWALPVGNEVTARTSLELSTEKVEFASIHPVRRC